MLHDGDFGYVPHQGNMRFLALALNRSKQAIGQRAFQLVGVCKRNNVVAMHRRVLRAFERWSRWVTGSLS